MEIILGFIWFIIVIISTSEALQGNLNRRGLLIWAGGSTIIYALVVTGGMLLGTTEVFNKKDVLTYKGTTYSTPKTVVETNYTAPFWSVADSSSYKVKGE